MKKETYVVTGGCGFIGSNLVERLVKLNCNVIVIDNLTTGFVKNIDISSDLVTFINYSVEQFDFNNLSKVDGVFHLAAQASVPLSIENFYESSKTNSLSCFKIISFCKEFKIPIVYASSSAVYGNLPVGSENDSVDLLSPYAVDKFSMEKYFEAAYNYSELPSFGLRFFNVYGPKQDPNSEYSGVISIFSDRLINNKEIFINGGYQTRDFIYVGDVVDSLIRAYNYIKLNKGYYISNILTGKSISINDLVKSLAEILKIKPRCIYRELPIGDPERSSGNTLTMEKILNVNLNDLLKIEEGLIKTIEWEKKKK
tara:strand:+ start:5181 stop:6116 length:936 start_codon:yes stop_codon:yes gene_type:complete